MLICRADGNSMASSWCEHARAYQLFRSHCARIPLSRKCQPGHVFLALCLNKKNETNVRVCRGHASGACPNAERCVHTLKQTICPPVARRSSSFRRLLELNNSRIVKSPICVNISTRTRHHISATNMCVCVNVCI